MGLPGYSEGNHKAEKAQIPEGGTRRPCDRHGSVSLCDICGVCYLRNHALYDAYISVQHTAEASTEMQDHNQSI